MRDTSAQCEQKSTEQTKEIEYSLPSTHKNIALIVAAGRGMRAVQSGHDLPKQYRMIGGKTVLAWTLSAFLDHDRIDGVCVVIHPDDRDLYHQCTEAFTAKLLDPALGGTSRQISVYNGLKALESYQPQNVLIHDAARPFITPNLISDLIETLESEVAVLPGRPVTDTLKRVGDHDRKVSETLPRDGLWQAQTPQCFHYNKILQAHGSAQDKALDHFTDDASIAEWHGLEVYLINGWENNRKLTTADDFTWAEQHLEQNKSMANFSGSFRTGSGFDVHAFTQGDHVILCGVNIPHTQTLKGHSDADVGMHALTDALLGSIGDGDIGTHFPPSDPQWKGAASDVFLKDAIDRINRLGGRIQNIDVTLICEQPKIGPHRAAMRKCLSEIMDLDVSRISIKATTTEQLGFTGRGEGIAAMATASVILPETF